LDFLGPAGSTWGKDREHSDANKAQPRDESQGRQATAPENVQASDARKRETGLVRIAIWVPLDQADAFKQAAKRAVDQHLNPVSPDRDQSLIPKPWHDPKRTHDRWQDSLPQ
jgi:hypothetical protein